MRADTFSKSCVPNMICSASNARKSCEVPDTGLIASYTLIVRAKIRGARRTNTGIVSQVHNESRRTSIAFSGSRVPNTWANAGDAIIKVVKIRM